MDTFNYLSVMISIILGVGVTTLFVGIGNLLQIKHRIKHYWLFSLWVLILITAHVHLWWSLWALRESVVWTYLLFLYLLIGPAILVIAGHILIPGEFYGQDGVDHGLFDLKQHYYDSSPLFFGIFAVVVAWAMILEPVLGVRNFFVTFRIVQIIGFILVSSCAIYKNKTLHEIVGIAITVLLAGVMFLSRSQAGMIDFSE